MGFCPAKPIISWKQPESKMYLIFLTYQTPPLSLTCHTRAQNTCISLQLGKSHLTQSLFYNEVSDMSCNWSTAVPNVASRRVVWVQKGHRRISFSSCGWVADCTFTTQHCEGIGLHLTSLGKDPNSQSKAILLGNSYHFCTIVKWKTSKPNHGNEGWPAMCKSDGWATAQVLENRGLGRGPGAPSH